MLTLIICVTVPAYIEVTLRLYEGRVECMLMTLMKILKVLSDWWFIHHIEDTREYLPHTQNLFANLMKYIYFENIFHR